MKVVFEEPANQDDADAKALLTTTGTVRTFASLINDTVVLPNDTPIVFTSQDPGGAGPFYDPQARQINFPYSFVSFIAQTFKDNEPDITDEDLAVVTDNAVDWILLHEMGHALVDQLQIPVLAKEEDTADNIAMVLLSLGGEDGGKIALAGADLFAYLQQDPSKLQESAFWDEHSLDLQRANETACLVYGSDPKTFAGLADSIPPERRDRCPDEWQQVSSGVMQVLQPYLKA
jgi:Putative metallopeptidase